MKRRGSCAASKVDYGLVGGFVVRGEGELARFEFRFRFDRRREFSSARGNRSRVETSRLRPPLRGGAKKTRYVTKTVEIALACVSVRRTRRCAINRSSCTGEFRFRKKE